MVIFVPAQRAQHTQLTSDEVQIARARLIEIVVVETGAEGQRRLRQLALVGPAQINAPVSTGQGGDAARAGIRCLRRCGNRLKRDVLSVPEIQRRVQRAVSAHVSLVRESDLLLVAALARVVAVGAGQCLLWVGLIAAAIKAQWILKIGHVHCVEYQRDR